MPNHPKTVNIDGFKGLNNVLKPERTPPQYFKEADNVDIDKSGGLQKREGFSSVASGVFHSCWASDPFCFVVRDSDLVSVDNMYNTTVVKAGVGDNPVSYFRLYDEIFFSSISTNGIIEDGVVRPWGLEPPSSPTLADAVGTLRPGTYQVTLTFKDSEGRESGAKVASLIDVVSGGIQLTNIPSNPAAATVNIYMSHTNGDEMYYKGVVANGTTSYTITDDSGLRRRMDTFNMMPAPKGHIIAEAHSRAWVAEDNFLWYSEPFQYELFDYRKNYIQFPTRIRAVMPVEGGMWVASDGLYYIAGDNPDTAKMELKEPIKVVEGSAVRIPGAYIFIENTPIGYKWLVHANKGIYVCFNDGIALNMTSQNYEFPIADEGVAAFIQKDGINRYTSLLKTPAESESTAVGDLVTATIVRNGVVVTD